MFLRPNSRRMSNPRFSDFRSVIPSVRENSFQAHYAIQICDDFLGTYGTSELRRFIPEQTG